MCIDYSFFSYAVKKIYLTEEKTGLNLATCSSPTEGAQIMFNNFLFSTSTFS